MRQVFDRNGSFVGMAGPSWIMRGRFSRWLVNTLAAYYQRRSVG